MALLYANSFGQYGTGGGREAVMTGEDIIYANNDVNITEIETGRGKIRFDSGFGGGYIGYQLPGDYTTLVVGMRLWQDYAWVGEPIIAFYDSGTQMLQVDQNAGGLLYVRRGSTTILTSHTALAVGTDSQWQIKVVFHDSAGEVYLYRNGVLDASVTGVDTINAGTQCDRLYMISRGGFNGYWSCLRSDFWVDDADLLGPAKVVYEPCDTAGTNADFTATGEATNEECVDETSPNDDTDYNVSTTDTDKDSFLHSAGTTLVGSLLGIQVIARARKEDANNSGIKLGVIHDASTDESAEKTLSTSYSWFYEMFLTNPSTSSAWDADDVPDAESSYEHVDTT
jgi:hypothetical protein